MFLANLGIILIPESTTKTTPPNNKYENTDWLPDFNSGTTLQTVLYC